MATLADLQQWYASNCDGDWEHQQGIEIGTLDNPGWRVDVDLEGTPLEGAPFEEVSKLEPERDWISCKVKDGRFQGHGGPFMLGEILDHFLGWARRVDSRAEA